MSTLALLRVAMLPTCRLRYFTHTRCRRVIACRCLRSRLRAFTSIEPARKMPQQLMLREKRCARGVLRQAHAQMPRHEQARPRTRVEWSRANAPCCAASGAPLSFAAIMSRLLDYAATPARARFAAFICRRARALFARAMRHAAAD